MDVQEYGDFCIELTEFLERNYPLTPAEDYIPELMDKYKSMLGRALSVTEDFRGKKFDESINTLFQRIKYYRNYLEIV